jgi:hypothetical protein
MSTGSLNRYLIHLFLISLTFIAWSYVIRVGFHFA